MNLWTRATRPAVVAALTVTALAIAAPALAEKIDVADPADTSASLNDIRRVIVGHGPRQVFVKVKFTDLRPNSDAGPASIGIFIDTDPALAGPEYRLGSGLQRGTDYQLMRIRDHKPVGQPLTCAHTVKLDYAADVLKFRAARTCLKTPDEVRVGVKMTDLYDGSHPVHDWLGEPKSFTSWVASS